MEAQLKKTFRKSMLTLDTRLAEGNEDKRKEVRDDLLRYYIVVPYMS
jgi:hypothetical protein